MIGVYFIETRNFSTYYLQYLGVSHIDKNKTIILNECSQRENSICNWYYHHLIFTIIRDKFIFSIERNIFEDFTSFISKYEKHNFDEYYEIINHYFSKNLKNTNVNKMYRMTYCKGRTTNLESNNAVVLTKELLLETLIGKDEKEKDDILLRKQDIVEKGRQFVITENNNIVSWAKISDIDFNGGNIAVWTSPDHRCKGFGKEVVKAAILWCIKNDIIPVYSVDFCNIASLKLAESIGLKIMSEEVVVSTQLR